MITNINFYFQFNHTTLRSLRSHPHEGEAALQIIYKFIYYLYMIFVQTRRITILVRCVGFSFYYFKPYTQPYTPIFSFFIISSFISYTTPLLFFLFLLIIDRNHHPCRVCRVCRVVCWTWNQNRFFWKKHSFLPNLAKIQKNTN